MGCNRVLPGHRVNPSGHTGFFISLFFLQPSPVPTPDRPTGPGFKTMTKTDTFKIKYKLNIIMFVWNYNK
jgi:hypothetical protein